MDAHHPEIKRTIQQTGELTAETEAVLKAGLEEFRKLKIRDLDM